VLEAESAPLILKDKASILSILPNDFSFSLETLDGKNLIPSSSGPGIHINGNPVSSVKQDPKILTQFHVETKVKESAIVTVTSFLNGIKFLIAPQKTSSDISIHTNGMGPAYGLGDHGSFLKQADISKSGKSHQLTNDGGSNRWISSFLVFPKQQTAGVVFSRDVMGVKVDRQSYSMSVKKTSKLSCYYLYGTMPEIYRAYQKVRHQVGYSDVFPKPRLFELGWETWDALGWQTNPSSVKEYLTKFNKAGYPIRWAVTGSGFWEEGGTTTSFGKFNKKKYASADSLKKWMRSQDIYWMIGQRTNFVALGGPHKLKGRRNGNASMDMLKTGPFTAEGLKKDYFYNDKQTYKSGIFPLAPCHLLDGNKSGAAEWYASLYQKWNVDGVKEDTMIGVSDVSLFNKPMTALASNKALVMARCGAFSSPGTLLRINDTGGHGAMKLRTPMNYLQYAASGAPNVYSDTVGFHSMKRYSDANIRHAWLSSLQAGMAVGRGPWSWTQGQQALLKKTVDLHYALFPYLYDAAVDSYHTGYPATMTPLHIAFPDDANTYNLVSAEKRQFQWMIGESLMATPLLSSKGKDKLTIYLPRGKWMDYDSGKIFQGPATLKDYHMPVDKTPCFVGGKGVIVLRESDNKSLVARVFPVTDGKSVFTFTHPDGKSTSIITNNNSHWDHKRLQVINLTNKKAVHFKTDQVIGSISFPIRPGVNYSIQNAH
jgi:alpha-glucosidase (family GH31 glycosyl hydrolase)